MRQTWFKTHGTRRPGSHCWLERVQEELLRQQQDFREVHQQDLMKQKDLQKFQNSTFVEFAQKKFIEDQKITMQLSERLQELQNEVNCMNDSRDFRDAESICSGNSHVTSPPGLFPRHPPLEGLLKPAFISQRQTEEPPNIRDTSGISGNVFAHPQASSSEGWLSQGYLRRMRTSLGRLAAESLGNFFLQPPSWHTAVSSPRNSPRTTLHPGPVRLWSQSSPPFLFAPRT